MNRTPEHPSKVHDLVSVNYVNIPFLLCDKEVFIALLCSRSGVLFEIFLPWACASRIAGWEVVSEGKGLGYCI